MTNPTNDDQNDRPRLRLRLDSGEVLEVDGTTVDSGLDRPAPAVVLRLTPWRAHDLAHVLQTYTEIMEVVTRSSEVSGTEESLSRGLYDAAELLTPGAGRQSIPLGKVTSGRRLRAMAAPQEHRPDLDHSQLIAVVDAAAMWTDEDQDYLVTALLGAVGGEEVAGAAYMALTGIDRGLPAKGPEGTETASD